MNCVLPIRIDAEPLRELAAQAEQVSTQEALAEILGGLPDAVERCLQIAEPPPFDKQVDAHGDCT
jgi:hypothetical protein